MEFAMIGMHLYLEGLMNKGPEWINSGLEKAEVRVRNRRESAGIGILVGAMAREYGTTMPNRLERR